MSSLKKFWKLIACLALALAMTVTLVPGLFGTSVFADKGDEPAHAKTIKPNMTQATEGQESIPDGTYKLELSVTGDAEDKEDQKAANVNVLIVYDVSSSMMRNDGTGDRYSRADHAEDVVHDFIDSLRTYQNQDDPSNIEVALVTFGPTATQRQTWTSNLTGGSNGVNRFFNDGVDGTVTNSGTNSHNYNSNNGTNWQAALTQAQGYLNVLDQRGDTDPTFVVLVTDGACTASGNGQNAINPNTTPPRPWTDFQPFYNAARTPARNIETRDNTTLFGIYAYGNEADLLDDLIYYANEGSDRPGMNGGTVEDTENYYNASDSSKLNAAIESIFQKIVQALGITEVSITDGTTSEVMVGTQPVDLLEVDTDSFEYWLQIPLVNNQFTRKESSGTEIKDIVYTVSGNGPTYTITWTDAKGTDHSVDVTGEKTSSYIKYQWTGANDLYNVAPPNAYMDGAAVKWNLSRDQVGTLLNGVTYSVTFDVYPSQTTLDIVADIKNNPNSWNDLPAAVQQYIDQNGNLLTNTTTDLSYMDTREETPETHHAEFNELDPVSSTAVEQMAISKDWKNLLESTWKKPSSIDFTVLRDEESHGTITLNDDNEWESGTYISIGIMKDGEVLEGSEGHDFTFVEPGGQEGVGWRWEVDIPTVHPMMIDGVVKMLVKVDEDHPLDGRTPIKIGEGTYYEDEEVVSLTATNERRSSLILKKEVTADEGTEVPDATFPFTATIENSLAPEEPPEGDTGHDSDYWIWISVRDKDNNPVTAEGTVTEATHDGGGWYYAPNKTAVTINVKDGYSIRFNNLPTGSKYTITEGDLPANFNFVKAAIAITEGDTEAGTDTFAEGQTSTGEIEGANAVYTITYTNEYSLTDVTVKKVWDDADDFDQLRPDHLDLTLNGAPQGTTIPTPTVDKKDNTWTYTWKGLPAKNANGDKINYSVTEEDIPDGYTCEGPTVDNGKTITNKHTPPTPTDTQIVGKKVVEGYEGDLSKMKWDFTITGTFKPAEATSEQTGDDQSGQTGDQSGQNNEQPQQTEEQPQQTEEQPQQTGGDEVTGLALEEEPAVEETPIVEEEPAVEEAPAVELTIPEAAPAVDEEETVEAKADGDEATEKTAPLPADFGGKNTVQNEGNKVVFGEIKFERAGTYTYTITESGKVDNVENDKETTRTVVVTVEEKDGELVATIEKDDEGFSFTFTNKYTAPDPGTDYIDPPVKKVIKGPAPETAETYTFKLEAADPSAPMPEAANGQSSMTTTITGEGAKEFGKIYFTKEHANADGSAKAYDYTVTEVAGDNADCEYDSTVYAVRAYVSVKDNKLNVKREYYKDGEQIDTAKFVFTNTYAEAEDEEEGGNGTKTGDDSNILGALALLLMAGAGLGGLYFTRRRKDQN